MDKLWEAFGIGLGLIIFGYFMDSETMTLIGIGLSAISGIIGILFILPSLLGWLFECLNDLFGNIFHISKNVSYRAESNKHGKMWEKAEKKIAKERGEEYERHLNKRLNEDFERELGKSIEPIQRDIDSQKHAIKHGASNAIEVEEQNKVIEAEKIRLHAEAEEILRNIQEEENNRVSNKKHQLQSLISQINDLTRLIEGMEKMVFGDKQNDSIGLSTQDLLKMAQGLGGPKNGL